MSKLFKLENSYVTGYEATYSHDPLCWGRPDKFFITIATNSFSEEYKFEVDKSVCLEVEKAWKCAKNVKVVIQLEVEDE
jgi:hypothetical protein